MSTVHVKRALLMSSIPILKSKSPSRVGIECFRMIYNINRTYPSYKKVDMKYFSRPLMFTWYLEQIILDHFVPYG